jgi:thiamine monophosphate synthase
MNRIDTFKQHLEEKRAVKVIAGIDNFDIENIKKVVACAQNSGASAVDICADESIVSEVRKMTGMPVFVSSVVPEELAKAVELGADAIELGNFDVLYKKGLSFCAADVLELAQQTIELAGSDVFFCVTVPGEISVAEQIKLARQLEEMGVDLIQTEGHFSKSEQSDGVRGLMERAELTISNTIELTRNVDLPVMSATGINPTTAPFAFAAGASAIGAGSCVNKLNSELAMSATITSLVEIASQNAKKIAQRV